MGKTSPSVLVIDDEPDLLELIELALLRMGMQVERAASVAEAIRKLESHAYDLCLTDMRLPDGEGLEVVRYISEHNLDIPVAVITAHGNMDNAVLAFKAGAFDYLSKPVTLDSLRSLVKAALKLSQQPEIVHGKEHRELLGGSEAMQKVRELIDRVSRSQAPVHITGESGSGKEMAARLIVEKSVRRDQPFIAVNCGAIPENLMESEFFGYRKGAFTGADSDREGFFQAANGGTLFLDEVADLPLHMQVKLLRVIQEKKVRKVGATQEEPVDVRILSATHRSLADLVSKGRFRQDLFYRLNVIPLHMPALREMRSDIREIAEKLLAALCHDESIRFSPAAIEALCNYDFPGNVRELENIIERAVALCADGIIEPADLQLAPVGHDEAIDGEMDEAGKQPLPDYLDRIERAAILDALDKTGFNRTAAAKLLGVTFRALRYRMERLNITRRDEE